MTTIQKIQRPIFLHSSEIQFLADLRGLLGPLNFEITSNSRDGYTIKIDPDDLSDSERIEEFQERLKASKVEIEKSRKAYDIRPETVLIFYNEEVTFLEDGAAPTPGPTFVEEEKAKFFRFVGEHAERANAGKIKKAS